MDASSHDKDRQSSSPNGFSHGNRKNGRKIKDKLKLELKYDHHFGVPSEGFSGGLLLLCGRQGLMSVSNHNLKITWM